MMTVHVGNYLALKILLWIIFNLPGVPKYVIALQICFFYFKTLGLDLFKATYRFFETQQYLSFMKDLLQLFFFFL